MEQTGRSRVQLLQTLVLLGLLCYNLGYDLLKLLEGLQENGVDELFLKFGAQLAESL